MNAFKQNQIDMKQAKQRLYNLVWRASFMILGDEDKAEKIANEATDPSAIKDDVVVPDTISVPNQAVWACVYKSAFNNCGDSEQAILIANDVCNSADIKDSNDGAKQLITSEKAENNLNTKSHSTKNIAVSSGGLIVQRNGGPLRKSSAIKSADTNSPEDGYVEGYLVSWGSTKDTDLQGEFFSPRTEFCLDWFGERPVLYHHGMDDSTGLKKIGTFKSIKVDDIGLWVQAQLDLRDRYARAVYDMVAAKQFGWSSGSVDHLVKIGENGEILVWPLIEGSITPTPAQPAKTAVRPIKSLNATGSNNSVMTMQAFKAVLSGDAESSEYLRGLEDHIRSIEQEIPRLTNKAQARVATQKSTATRTYEKNGSIEGDFKSMARNESAWYITRAVAKAFGIKDATPEELAAVANEVQDVVSDEVNAAAAQALENEASITADENLLATTASYNRKSTSRGQAYRQAVPPQDSTASDDDGIASIMSDTDEAIEQDQQFAGASYRTAMRQADVNNAASIESAMMSELEAQMEDEQFEAKAARALRRRAWNRAIRQIADTPDSTSLTDSTMQEQQIMQDPNANPLAAASYRRAMRQAQMPIAQDQQGPIMQEPIPATMQDVGAPIMQDAPLSEDVITDVAQASYRRGFRSGVRSAYREYDSEAQASDDSIQSAVMADEDQSVAKEVSAIASATDDADVVNQAARAYRAGYRRGLNRAVRQLEMDTQSEASTASDEVPATMQDIAPVAPATMQAPQAAAASYARRGMRQVQPAAPGVPVMQAPIMQVPTAPIMQDGSYMQDQGFVPATMQDVGAPMVPPGTIASYGRRGYAYRDGVIGAPPEAFQSAEDEAMEMDPAVAQFLAQQADDSIVPAGAMTSYRGASRGYGYRQLDPSLPPQSAQMDGEMTAAEMADDMLAQAADLDSVAQYEIKGVTPVRNYNQHAYRSASAFDGGSAYDAQRQAEYWRRRAQELEAVEAPNQRAFKSLGVKDVADRPGAYNSAFKSYLMKGLGLMTDTEKYILQGKGKARWENASFSYDTSTKSVKTYSSGSDASAGFLVPEDWVNELNKNVMTQTVMAPECKTRTTTSDRIVQPNLNTTDARRAHPAQVRWPGESPAASSDHRTVEDDYTQVTIPIHVMLITLAATNSALEDATFNLEEEINEAFAEAVAVSYDQLIWSGDGQGKLQGIVTNSQVVGSPSLGMKTVGGYVATGSADGIVTADSLKTMLFHLPQGYRQRAKWYMNSNTGLQVATLKDSMGNYLIDQRDDALRTVGVPDRLLNKPIVYNEWADDADSGNFPIILADLTRGYIIGRRVEFSIRRFDDSNYAEHDQVLFLGRARLGGQVLQPASFKALKVALS